VKSDDTKRFYWDCLSPGVQSVARWVTAAEKPP